ncbi:transposase IS4 family protein [mine drainage metagenome]|uniref:Transposase IS4 family protein n=1 Tax=mine drainage metagenome TaxID=410659 RepID=T1C8W9_9ZZZZ
MDSTAVHGAGAVQDTYQLIRGAIRRLRKKAGRVAGLASRLDAVLQRDDYGKVGKPDIDWQDPKARQDLLNEIVRDGHAAVAATRELLAAGKEDAAVTEAVDLLARVVEQDIEPVEGADEVRIRQGVAKDRVVSTTDPEMRHGHKTSSGRFDGAKVNATLDEDSQLITDVGVIKGNESDSIAVMPALEREERLEILPRELMGDHAYGVMPLRPQVAERRSS